MKKINFNLPVLLFALLFLLFAQKELRAKEHSLCKTGEKIIFSCRLKGPASKTVSICASKNLSEKTGYLKYRFGKPKAIELEYPQTNENTLSAFRLQKYYRPSQGDLKSIWTYSLSFENEGHRYEVHSDYNGDYQGGGRDFFGVIVDGDENKALHCKGAKIDHFRDAGGIEDLVPKE